MIRFTDITRAAALELRKVLLNQDFQLGNRFCDAQELENAWKHTIIPDSVIQFLSALLSLKKISLLKQYREQELQTEKNSDNIPMKCTSLLQIMYYNMYGRRKKIPLHVTGSVKVEIY